MAIHLFHHAITLISIQTCFGRLKSYNPHKRYLDVISCVAIIEDEEAKEDLKLNCEKEDGTSYPIVGVQKFWISEKLKQGELRSGEDTIVLPISSKIVSGEIIVPPGEEISIIKGKGIPCLAMVENEENKEDLVLNCERADGTSFPLVGIEQSWIKKKLKTGELDSGNDTIILPIGSEFKDDEIFIPPGKEIIIKKGLSNDRVIKDTAAKAKGVRSILVVRVLANDGQTTSSREKLSDDVFGTGLQESDLVNVKSQYIACSYGQLIFESVKNREAVDGSDIGIKYGVTEVNIKTNVRGRKDRNVENDVTIALNKKFGVRNPGQLADHVMYCIPPGTGDWVAYAAVNGWKSVYNDVFCGMVSANMHEIGHNLGLCHSGEGKEVYGDQSGMMGYSYKRDDTSMCFNAAKSWQLGWYHDHTIEVHPVPGTMSNYKLIGVVDYENRQAGKDHYVVIKVNTKSENDYYISFDRKNGINSDTREGADDVLVVEAGGEGIRCANSHLHAKLTAGMYSKLTASHVYSIKNFGNQGADLKITVTSINMSTNPVVADVSIVL